MEQVHQVIYNVIVTKDLDRKFFDYIYPWDENLASIAWEIKASCLLMLGSMTVKKVYGRDMLFKLASIVDWRVITAKKQRQVDIDNA